VDQRTAVASREANRTRYPSWSWTKNWDTPASVHLFGTACLRGP
jgi:hypothetical protein